jgi:hypothetical protein
LHTFGDAFFFVAHLYPKTVAHFWGCAFFCRASLPQNRCSLLGMRFFLSRIFTPKPLLTFGDALERTRFMRTLPPLITEALGSETSGSGAAKLCHIWIITRKDNVKLGFTDHDRDLSFQGVTCEAKTGFTSGAITSSLGLEASDMAISGVLSTDALKASEIEQGLYDGADISQFVIHWATLNAFNEPSECVPLMSGQLARLECRGGLSDQGQFIAHIEGPAARLNQVIGRRFTPLCEAALGDMRCGLSSGAILGRVCDKRFGTCKTEFQNTLNFRGFPDLPGEDFITLYPREGDVLDGRSRGQTR